MYAVAALQVALVAMVIEKQTLMHHIMRCDFEKVQTVMISVESEMGESRDSRAGQGSAVQCTAVVLSQLIPLRFILRSMSFHWSMNND